jgi:hypothetical protein
LRLCHSCGLGRCVCCMCLCRRNHPALHCYSCLLRCPPNHMANTQWMRWHGACAACARAMLHRRRCPLTCHLQHLWHGWRAGRC